MSNLNLTDEQKIILNNCDNNIYISACPGAGKSTLLSLIADKLLASTYNSLLLITFTNKAAKSILDKCKNLNKDQISGGTFHGLAFKMLKENGCTSTICDEGKKRLLVKKLFKCKSSDKDKLEEILDLISNAKSSWPYNPASDSRLQRYQDELSKYNLIDFDDIIINFNNVADNPSFRINPLNYILVDELQDTSLQQLVMLQKLQSKTNCKMIGVADEDQCIYEFRNARFENVEDFIKSFNCTIFTMAYNFRCAQKIVRSSSKLVENNKKRFPKTIRPARTEEGIVHLYQGEHFLEEIDYTVSLCKRFRNREIAILYRNRTHKNHLEFQLRKEQLKYVVNDFLEITDRSAIKVMLSLLRIASKEFDICDLENAAKAIKGLGPATIKKLEEEDKSLQVALEKRFCNPKKIRPVQCIKTIQDAFQRLRDKPLDLLVRECEKQFNKSFNYQDDMRSFLLDITSGIQIAISSIRELCNDLGLNAKEENRDEGALIELSTAHGYKGAEKDIVIIPWSYQYAPKEGEDIESERRLFYVAVTRAKNQCYITYTNEKPKFVEELKL